uniref:DNA repair protein RecO-like protein n=1 Tax=Cyanophora biloba TaxID=1489483 RepID=A0A2Z4HG91_9EUKA|nr:DNA repair protein RecO-like protein [Cyanophora biloba]AWW13795.1 DNA repair protein RecO-like protein [Cyanophora biloba]
MSLYNYVIILRIKQRNNFSYIYTLYTYTQGLKDVIVFSNQKFLLANFKLYNVYFCIFKKGNPLDQIKHIFPLYYYLAIEQHPLKTVVWEYLSEFIIYQLYCQENSKLIYNLLRRTLYHLNICSEKAILPILLRSLYFLLKFFGWQPQLYTCMKTGEKLKITKNFKYSNIGFSASYGGLVKLGKIHRYEYIGILNQEELYIFQKIIYLQSHNYNFTIPIKKFNKILIHLEYLLCKYIQYHIGKRMICSIKLGKIFTERNQYLEKLSMEHYQFE